MAANKAQLIDFVDYAAEKGLMKRSTARSLKAGCNTVLSVLDEAEEEDILNIDLESVFQRYENLHGLKVSPSTMKSYRQRVRYMVEEFGKYNNNRSGWKPSGGQRSTSASSKSKKPNDASASPSGHVVQDPSFPSDVNDAAQITHRFPLRRDSFVTITGIPFDVRKGEMARLNAFLANLVASAEDVAPSQPALKPATAQDPMERVG